MSLNQRQVDSGTYVKTSSTCSPELCHPLSLALVCSAVGADCTRHRIHRHNTCLPPTFVFPDGPSPFRLLMRGVAADRQIEGEPAPRALTAAVGLRLVLVRLRRLKERPVWSPWVLPCRGGRRRPGRPRREVVPRRRLRGGVVAASATGRVDVDGEWRPTAPRAPRAGRLLLLLTAPLHHVLLVDRALVTLRRETDAQQGPHRVARSLQVSCD